QGSSIGVTIVQENDEKLSEAIDRSFFIQRLYKKGWSKKSNEQKVAFIRTLTDIREGIGIPLVVSTASVKKITYHPEELLTLINALFSSEEEVLLESCAAETEIIIEGFITGKEFSCIVIRNEHGDCVALPPTEIRKGKELFDYRSKYLPGLSRKITPINLPYD